MNAVKQRALIVHAHPEPRSFNAALTNAAVETLQKLGMEVEVSDLYADGLEAVASRRDFLEMSNPERFGYAHEQKHAAERRGYAADILREQDRVAAADVVIFQFPLWWYAVPAILKGWADRVLSYGFAYTDRNVFDTGLLRGKRAMLSITTGGSAQELQDDSPYTGTVDEFLKPFSGGVLRFVGMDVHPPFIAYATADLTPVQRAEELERYRLHLLDWLAGSALAAASTAS